MTPTERLIAYLSAYAAKDLAAIEAMFDDGIRLRDWKISVVGKGDALAETRKNFESADSIAIEILQVHATDTSAAAELRIVVDDVEELYVVDVLTFSEDGLITSIRAYLGRPD